MVHIIFRIPGYKKQFGWEDLELLSMVKEIYPQPLIDTLSLFIPLTVFTIKNSVELYTTLEPLRDFLFTIDFLWKDSVATSYERQFFAHAWRDVMMWKIYEDWYLWRYDHHNYNTYFNHFVTTFKFQKNCWIWWKYWINYEVTEFYYNDLWQSILSHSSDVPFKFRKSKILGFRESLPDWDYTTFNPKINPDYQKPYFWSSSYYWAHNIGHSRQANGLFLYWYEHFWNVDVALFLTYASFIDPEFQRILVEYYSPSFVNVYYMPEMTQYVLYDYKWEYALNELFTKYEIHNGFRYLILSKAKREFDENPFNFV